MTGSRKRKREGAGTRYSALTYLSNRLSVHSRRMASGWLTGKKVARR